MRLYDIINKTVEVWEVTTIMPELFYKKMDEMFKELKIDLEDTNDKEKIKEAENFVATFTPQKEPIKIE